ELPAFLPEDLGIRLEVQDNRRSSHRRENAMPSEKGLASGVLTLALPVYQNPEHEAFRAGRAEGDREEPWIRRLQDRKRLGSGRRREGCGPNIERSDGCVDARSRDRCIPREHRSHEAPEAPPLRGRQNDEDLDDG